LKSLCYKRMFSGCTNLKKAPELPAKKMVTGCYDEIFLDCIKINEIRVGLTGWDSDEENICSCCDWLSGVAPNGKFICPEELPKEFGEKRIPEGWKIIKN